MEYQVIKIFKFNYFLLHDILTNKTIFKMHRNKLSTSPTSHFPNEQNQTTYHNQDSPKQDRKIRSNSRIAFSRQHKPIYLTDGQISSSDHTTKSISQFNIMRIEYEMRIKKLQRENYQLKELIVSLKATNFYQLDQQKIKNLVRENQFLKIKVSSLESEAKHFENQLCTLQVQAEFLKRNNQALMVDLQKQIKQTVRQKHINLLTENSIDRSPQTASFSYGRQDYEKQIAQVKQISKQKVKQKQTISSNDNQYNVIKKLPKRDKINNMLNNDLKEKVSQNQQSMDVQEKHSKQFRTAKKSTRHQSSSKSRQKALMSFGLGSRALLRKQKKLSTQILSTAQNHGLVNFRNYHSSQNLFKLNFKPNIEPEMKGTTSQSIHQNVLNQYTSYMKDNDKPNYGGKQYYVVRKQKHGASKKKKSIYYS